MQKNCYIVKVSNNFSSSPNNPQQDNCKKIKIFINLTQGAVIKGEGFTRIPLNILYESIAPYLHQDYQDLTNTNVELKIHEITKILVGHKSERIRIPKASKEISSLRQTVEYYVKRELPINAVIGWGAQKTFGVLKNHVSADFADFLGLLKFYNLHQVVRQYHEPGIHVKIIPEDWGESAIIFGTLDRGNMWKQLQDYEIMESNIQQYLIGLHEIYEFFEGQGFSIVRESEIFRHKGIHESEYEKKFLYLYELFITYWNESEYEKKIPVDLEDTRHELLESFKMLQKEGWQGGITKAQRKYYMERQKNELIGKNQICNVEDLSKRVCRYLSVTFLRAGSQFNWLSSQQPFIKFSYVRYPPDTPKDLYTGRIELRATKRRKSNNNNAPWAAVGGFRVNAKKIGVTIKRRVYPSLIGYRLFPKIPDLQQLHIHVLLNRKKLTYHSMIYRRPHT